MRRLLGGRFSRALVVDVVVGLMACLALLSSVYFYVRIQTEGRERRDQSCAIAEKKQAKDVRQLRTTYRYLLDLKPGERGDTINKTILQQLPEVEREAREDDAPPFCDEPGVGLPEPDSKIPRRPLSLR